MNERLYVVFMDERKGQRRMNEAVSLKNISIVIIATHQSKSGQVRQGRSGKCSQDPPKRIK